MTIESTKTKPLSLFFAFSLLNLLLLSGCSSRPSVSDGQAVFERSGYDKRYEKLIEFKKTDGQDYTVYGVQGYKMSFEATLESTADRLPYGLGGSFIENEFKKGERFRRSGTIDFTKSEKGWEGRYERPLF